MAKSFLLIGKSGVGKSYSLNTVPENEYALISVLGKELPFRTGKKYLTTDDYTAIKNAMLKYVSMGVKNIIIDDAGYLLTNAFMKAQGAEKKGNLIFELYSQMATNFYELVRFSQTGLPDDVIVGIIMHEDKNDFGDVKPKIMGKMLEEKVSVEGLFATVLHAMKTNNEYIFRTQTDGTGVTKSPYGMFDSETIPNDMNLVFTKIREYYNIGGKNNE